MYHIITSSHYHIITLSNYHIISCSPSGDRGLGVAAMLRLQPLQPFLSFFARCINAPSRDKWRAKKGYSLLQLTHVQTTVMLCFRRNARNATQIMRCLCIRRDPRNASLQHPAKIKRSGIIFRILLLIYTISQF